MLCPEPFSLSPLIAISTRESKMMSILAFIKRIPELLFEPGAPQQ